MERFPRRTIVVVVALFASVALAWVSGNQAPIDEIALASEATGVPFESRRVVVGDVDLHVVFAGPEDGPEVILLHGFPEFWYTWHAQMAALANAGYRVAAPDTRGTNRSDKPDDPAVYTDWQLVDDVVGILDALGWQQAYLGGHDVGGGTAWQLVFEQPERIRGAIIFNVPHPTVGAEVRPEDDEQSVSWFRSFFKLPFLPELLSRTGNWWLPSYYLQSTSREGAFDDERLDIYRSAWDRDGAMGKMINTYRAPITKIRRMPDDGRPTIPVRLIWGDKDAFVPLAGSRASEAYLEQGAIRHWPNESHWLLHEVPNRAGDEMIEFFDACCDEEGREGRVQAREASSPR